MLKRCLWLSALIAGWLMITACSSAHNTTPRYVPPGERTPLTADHQWPKNSFLVWVITMLKMVLPTSVTSLCVPAR